MCLTSKTEGYDFKVKTWLELLRNLPISESEERTISGETLLKFYFITYPLPYYCLLSLISTTFSRILQGKTTLYNILVSKAFSACVKVHNCST